MRGRARFGLISGLLALALAAGACGSSSSSGGGGGGGTGNTGTSTTSPSGNTGAAAGEHDILPPAPTGSPVTGGTLKIVGSGDVDHLDTCCAYYTTTYELLRAVSRQLVSYKTSRSDPSPATPVPDMATYTVSSDGLTYTFKIQQGVMWDAPSGPRQVTSQDAELGLKRLCNPVQPAPPLSYWENNIAGMKSFCDGFQALKLPSAQGPEIAALKSYINSHSISGITTPDSSTLVIKLMAPSSSFINIMAIPMSSPVPVEILNYLPASVQEEQNFISDGPYTITSYTPNVGYKLAKNPAWQQSTDPLRHQYFDAIDITEGQNPTTIQQELQTGDADLEWDTVVPSAQVQQLSSSPQFEAAYIGGMSYIAFNMKSTADGGALQKAAVRIALQYCVNKRAIIQVSGGPVINVASNQILPPQITGYKKISTYATPNDAGDTAKCKSMLAAAGYPNGLTLTLVYANNPPNPDQAQSMQQSFAQAGVTLKLLEQPQQGEYYNFVSTPANKSKWDLAFGGWFPDWQGNGAQSIFSPLFDGRLYGPGSTDYGDFNDPTANSMIDAAIHAPSVAEATTDWANLDNYLMTKNPPWIPLVWEALPQFIGKNVQGATYNGDLGYVDITNLWKTSS